MKAVPICCRYCLFMKLTKSSKLTMRNLLSGPRHGCMCKHPDAIETFNRVCPRSNREPAFIGYTAPGEYKPTIKTSPKWCPLRPEN